MLLDSGDLFLESPTTTSSKNATAPSVVLDIAGGGEATEDQVGILVATEEGLSAVRVFGCVRSHSFVLLV